MRSRQAAGRLLRADALFEVGLGLALVTSGRTGLHDSMRLPPPASLPATKTFGSALLPVAALLWREARDPAPARLQALAGVNAITAAAFTGWLARKGRSIATPGLLVLGTTSTILLGLAGAQARAATRLSHAGDS